jgi:sortase A
MIAAGVLILLFVAYQLWGTGIAEARSQDALRSDFLDLVQVPVTTTPRGTETTPTTGQPAPAPTPTGDAVAIIRIPRLDLEKAVVEGVSVADLKKGPGHYPTTPLPGQPGNAAIAGHRTTYGAPFFRLDEVGPGDDVFVATRQGEFRYRVSASRVVNPNQSEVLDPTDDNRLTLTTCHPRFSAKQRLVVVASLVNDPAPATPPPPAAETAPRPQLADEPGLSGDRAPRGPAVLWGSLAALVWLATWLLSRQWGRVTAYAMGTPVFLVVLFVFFENFARLLPANI